MRVAIEGLIGVGKSTLCAALKKYCIEEKQLNAIVVTEPIASNPYLEDFYKDPCRWALAMQIDLLCQRVAKIRSSLMEDAVVFYDRHLWGDKAFAHTALRKGYMTSSEYETYQTVFSSVVTPDLFPTRILYLNADLAVVFERIRSRGRACEKEIELDYLCTLDSSYKKILKGKEHYREIPYNNWEPVEAVWNALK